MRTTAIINQKGGVGKTTTAVNLAGGLATKGHTVLLIDLDPQCNLSYTLNALDAEITTTDILAGQRAASLGIEFKKKAGSIIDIIPASKELATADIKSGYTLKEALRPLEGVYDYCIIDTPPSIGILTANALAAADDIIITADADIYSLQGMGLLHSNLKAISQSVNPKLKVDGILITRHEGQSALRKQLKDQIEDTAELFNTRAYSKPIRKCVALAEANFIKTNIFDYKPNSNGAKDYMAFIEEYTATDKQ